MSGRVGKNRLPFVLNVNHLTGIRKSAVDKFLDLTYQAYHAQYSITQMLKMGLMFKPDYCSKCGKWCKPHGHHPDYDYPLQVEWLCHSCHRGEHRAERCSARQLIKRIKQELLPNNPTTFIRPCPLSSADRELLTKHHINILNNDMVYNKDGSYKWSYTLMQEKR